MAIPLMLGPRRALSLFVLGFTTTIFILVALAQGGAWGRCFFALAAAYGVAFFSVAAGWFWGRWYAMGLAASGITLSILGLVTSGWNASLAIWGGVHLLIYGPLAGDAMAELYEGQRAWRERYNLDENGVLRIKRAVKGAATALPTLIFFTLAPRDGSGLEGLLVVGGALGLLGLVRMRFWGVALLALTAVGLATQLGGASPGAMAAPGVPLLGAGVLALGALLYAVLPFLRPAARFLRS
jgi:hypothetical protein